MNRSNNNSKFLKKQSIGIMNNTMNLNKEIFSNSKNKTMNLMKNSFNPQEMLIQKIKSPKNIPSSKKNNV